MMLVFVVWLFWKFSEMIVIFRIFTSYRTIKWNFYWVCIIFSKPSIFVFKCHFPSSWLLNVLFNCHCRQFLALYTSIIENVIFPFSCQRENYRIFFKFAYFKNCTILRKLNRFRVVPECNIRPWCSCVNLIAQYKRIFRALKRKLA